MTQTREQILENIERKRKLSENAISMDTFDRVFRARLHFVLSEQMDPNSRRIIAVSYVGNPEAATAISAGIIEGRDININGQAGYLRGHQKFNRIERKIGMGDLVHSMVFNSAATITGIADSGKAEDDTISYIIDPKGDIKGAFTRHIISRFGLPPEWENDYYSLFQHLTRPILCYMNPDLQNIWPDIAAVRLETSEEKVLAIIDSALKSGRIKIPHSDVQGTFDPRWTMKEYMMNNNESMAAKLSEMKPRHTVDQKLDYAIATMNRMPFPTQAHMIQGILNAFEEEKSIFCSSDMGTGKSIQSIGVAHVLHDRRVRNNAKHGTAVLLSAPGITLGKWKTKEILGTLPHAKVTIIKNHKEVLALYRQYRNGYRIPKGEIHFFLIGIDKAKMGPENYYAGIWKRIKGDKAEYGFHCPDCGNVQMKWQDGTWSRLTWNDVSGTVQPTQEEIDEARTNGALQPNGLPKGFKPKWKSTRKHDQCCYKEGKRPDEFQEVQCGTKMYRPAVKSREETKLNPRANISRVLKRFNGWFDLYICDEVHKSKGSGSGRGDAFASMVKAAKRNLLLTGTLVNGKSSSIKELLWRTDAKSLIRRGFDHATSDVEWAKQYGKLEQVIVIEEEVKNGVVTNQSTRARQPVEGPGIAPHMTAEYLLHKTGFMELGDMGLPLVELKEIPIFVDMDPDHYQEYQLFHSELYDLCKKKSAGGNKGAWSKFTPSTLMYGDRPDMGAEIVMGEDVIVAPTIEGYHAKERALVDLVKKELSEDRGCVIYNTYTGLYGMNEHLLEVLTAHGIKAEILNEPNTDKRGEALQVLADREVKVFITNMKNVEVGLDLLYWPTIINYQMSYEVSVFRQSNRRNWRIGQDKECRCYILAYNGTQQMAQFMKVMSGRGHALLTEGRLDKSDLAQFSRDEQSSLASDLADCFASSDLADAWTELAAKDLADVEMVGEANFKQVIAERMKSLSKETMRLCGPAPVRKALAKEVVTLTSVPAPASPVSIWGDAKGFDYDTSKLFSLEEDVVTQLPFLQELPTSTIFDSFEQEVEGEPEQLSLFDLAV